MLVNTVASAEAALLPARNQMALSLGWHIVIACFGMAWPAIIFVMHRMGLRGNKEALELAKRWSKVSGVLFAIGAVSGTILSFEMGLLWPVLMERFGDVVGLAFALEGISFFLEAIFLGLYVYSWGKLPGKLHSLMLIPIMVAGVFGSFFVVSVNAWMNSPTGFDTNELTGEIINIDPLAAIFNSAVWYQFLHMFLAAYMVVGFSVAGVYAAGMLRGKTGKMAKLGITIPLIFAACATMAQPFVGHFAGQRIADEQPIKLAAMEGIFESETAAPLKLGGIYSEEEQKLKWAITLPIKGALSFQAKNDFNAEITGLAEAEEEDRPPVNIVRFAFQTMLAIGFALVGLVLWAAHRWKRSKEFLASKPFLVALVAAGPLAAIALEAGWVTTEVGRQPWVVHKELRTEDAVTDSPYIWVTLTVLFIVYSAMTAGAIAVIRSMSKRWAAGEKDLATPYGPATALQLDPNRHFEGGA